MLGSGQGSGPCERAPMARPSRGERARTKAWTAIQLWREAPSFGRVLIRIWCLTSSMQEGGTGSCPPPPWSDSRNALSCLTDTGLRIPGSSSDALGDGLTWNSERPMKAPRPCVRVRTPQPCAPGFLLPAGVVSVPNPSPCLVVTHLLSASTSPPVWEGAGECG